MAYWHTHQLVDHGYLKLVTTSGYRSVAKTLAHVMSQDSELKMSQTTLSKQACESVRTVQRALDQLEDFRLISRHRQGRRNAEVIRWHACPIDCDIASHTGKTDTTKPALSKESTADGFPKPKRKRKSSKTRGPRFVPLEPETRQADVTEVESETRQIVKNPGVSDQLTSLKDKPLLNTGKSISVQSETRQADVTEAYASLSLAVEALAADSDYDALNSEVLLHLLNDYENGLEVAALAVKTWGTIPQPFTHDFSEQLVRCFEKHTDKDTGPLYMAIYRYNKIDNKRGPWRNLSATVQSAIIRKSDLLESADLSEVAPTLTETVTYASTFPPHSVQVEDLTARLSAISRD